MMTPQEVANCTFAKAVMGGYNMASVDDFLDKLTEDYAALYKENAALKSKLKVVADKLEEYREVEDAMRSTLLTAQKMASSMVSEAEAKRDALIADAAGAAKRRLEEIQQELADQEQRLADKRREVDEATERGSLTLLPTDRTLSILLNPCGSTVEGISYQVTSLEDGSLVENGTVTLIGATTENPSFEVIRPLLSRCQVYVLNPLNDDDLLRLLDRVLHEDSELCERDIEVRETAAMLRYSGGDARKFLNILELLVSAEPEGKIVITDSKVEERLQQNPAAYDKNGEMHYDIISAFIKSIRGSDPDAALYWLARMIEGGEDPAFIARRLIISASEDIGLANPNALLLANAAFDAVMKIGWPEGRIPLAEATVYLATSPKSNSGYMGIGAALEKVRQSGNLPVPLHLRNAPTDLMKKLGYSKGYKYAHDYEGNFVNQQYLPDEIKNTVFWTPQDNPSESRMKERMERIWNRKYPPKS